MFNVTAFMKRNRYILLLVALLAPSFSFSQKDVKDFILQQVKEIKYQSFDQNQESFDFLDLLVKDKKVVFLGAQDPGDAPTIAVKSRIIKHLHQKLGFNVVLFESDFFALNDSQNSVENIHEYWEECGEFQPRSYINGSGFVLIPCSKLNIYFPDNGNKPLF